jgi:hypothetical protein
MVTTCWCPLVRQKTQQTHLLFLLRHTNGWHLISIWFTQLCVYVCTGWSKSHAKHSLHMFYLSELNYNEIRKQKTMLKCWKCPPRSAMHAITIFLMFDATRWRVSVSRKRFTRRDIVDLFGTEESGGSVRRWTLVLVKKTSLHFDSWGTTNGLARIWCDLIGLLYSHSDTVCLLIQSNCIELQPSVNILIRAVWFFDHYVYMHFVFVYVCMYVCTYAWLHACMYGAR